ncbi:SRPBCC domain-containing protein [Streptomyces albireticuli]|uniref:Polyketide cyclase n=1 Tax=Streptomyces albireticuli TaxID=1940 RepID=A0A2A2DG43_9ACTN|nr:SRPBCC domain-containing protein [Streptomyces albireticuli]MCD9141162.1 SRPBCC domain-containing protein [Streptomyces albireticuli]MCD9160877.1 SRPBCC domain-containing protein [Streptomyces albireticuli]MCD9191066.1 SRPBCC domain-containing protein [Streptomyces albireticuli]PAU50407.1 hypothetical protein CK936_02690 [Streptomyces albireticuli]
MREISEETEIRAEPMEVWSVLTDLRRYPEWNPFIRRADGRVAAGRTLTLRMFPARGRPMTFRPRVLTAEPGRELRWLGRLPVPGLFEGEHRFLLTPVAGGTRLVQSEAFRGLLVPLLERRIRDTRTDFRSLNAALKARAERRPPV